MGSAIGAAVGEEPVGGASGPDSRPAADRPRRDKSRDYKANYYSTTLSGILAHVSEEGTEDDSASKFEKGLSPAYGELNLSGIGRLPYRLFLLKEDYDAGNFSHGVYFTLNGQVHGDLPANFITTTLKFDYLSKDLGQPAHPILVEGLRRVVQDAHLKVAFVAAAQGKE